MLARRSLAPVGLAVVLSLGGAFFVPQRITGSELAGRVVDARTGAALGAANIVAVWELERGTLGGQTSGGWIQVLETTSGPDGRYRFPKWSKWLSCATCAVNDQAAPQLFVFKATYEPARFTNPIWPPNSMAPVPFHAGGTYRSEWNGKDLLLTPSAAPDSQDYLIRVHSFAIRIHYSGGDDGWPGMTTAIERVTGQSIHPQTQGRKKK